MHPILSNRDTLMAFILSIGLILASVLAFSSTLQAPDAGLAAIEPSTLSGGSAAADIQNVAYLESGRLLRFRATSVPSGLLFRKASPH